MTSEKTQEVMDDAKDSGLGNGVVESFTEMENTSCEQNGDRRAAWNSR